jgi:thiaminase/transcriptional activator TenA
VTGAAVSDLPAEDPTAWARATRHPFLSAVRDGRLPETAFAAWLVQDYHFVTGLLRFQARLLARAPRFAQPVLAGGAVALVDELGWFERHADKRGLDLSAAPLPATLHYAELLERLDKAPVEIALPALWAIERAYLEAWSTAVPGAPQYREFVDHWTEPAFAEYVATLAAAADRALSHGADLSGVRGCFAEIVQAESNFWDMALAGGRP